MRYISQLSIGDTLVKKRLDANPARNMQVEIRRAVVYVSQLGCEGELELLAAIQVYA